jgi:L-fuconolactonase
LNRIDSHHHFWQYSVDQYPWISDSMSVLRRDFMPEQLLTETQSTHIDGVISVQARQTVEETRWLLEQARSHDWIRGVVGWLPLASKEIAETMQGFAAEKKLVGLRHVVQDETDDGFLSRPEFNHGIRSMLAHGWTYDLLIFARQLPFAIPFVDRHPDQVFVLDHIAKPTIGDGKMDEAWAKEIRNLARRPNVYCKFSGVVTEVRDESWGIETIRPYWDIALEAFGAKRMMFGTDWPVCLLKATYQDWVATVSVLASKLSETEQMQFWSSNAIKAYRLA